MSDQIRTESKKWVVFDIDGTLSMTIDPEEYDLLGSELQEYFVPITYKPFERRNIRKTAQVMMRPHLEKLLEFVFNNFRVGIWSIGQPGYATAIVKLLFGKYKYKPEFVYNFTHCVREYDPSLRFYKPLRESPARNGIIIDDNPNVIDQEDKFILIERFDIYKEESGESEGSDEDEMVDPILLLGDDCLIRLIDKLEEYFVHMKKEKIYNR